MPSFTYANAYLHSIATPAAPLTGTWYGQLMGPGFVFDPDTMDTRASVTSGEITPVGSYTAGGKALAVTIATASAIVTTSIAQTQWSGANITGAQGMLIYYRPTGSIPSEQYILGWNNFGSPQNHIGGIFRVEAASFDADFLEGGAHIVPTATLTAIFNKQLILYNATVYAMLLTASYTPNVAHSFRSSLTAFEVSAAGYTAGGIVCPLTINRDDTANKTIIKFNGPIFPAATYTAQYVAFYQRLGGASSADRVILIMNFGVPYSSGGNVLAVGDNIIEISALAS